MRPGLLSALLAVFWLAVLSPIRAGDWPMFGRDNSRNAVSPEKDPPIRWQAEERDNGVVTKPGLNVLWKARLGSHTFAPPTVSGGLIWIGTNNNKPRDPAKIQDASVLMCFRASDGHFLWQYFSPRLENQSQANWGISCAPLDDGDRLYFTTNRHEAVCLDIGPLKRGKGEPKLLWKLDMIKELGVAALGAYPSCREAYTCSFAAAYKGRLYLTTGNGTDDDATKPSAPEAPSLVCLDRDNGKVLWKDNSPGKNIMYGQWSSPLVAEIKGRGQVIAAQGDGWVRSFDALTGKLIWQFDTNPKNAVWIKGSRKSTRNYLVATPVYAEGRVYIANGRDPSWASGPGRLFCIDPTREGDVSPELDNGTGQGKPNPNSGAVWRFEGRGNELAEQMQYAVASVAVHDGLVIAPVTDGYIHCLDAKTGQRYWTHDAQAQITASPLIIDGKVFIGDHEGNVTVLALSKTKKGVVVNEMDETLSASIVFANGVLYIPGGQHLYAVKAGKRR